MKNILSLVLVLIFAISLCGCGVKTTPKEKITQERAITIALDNAKLAKKDVKNIEADFDGDEKRPQWEVSFEIWDYEYSYDIDAYSGEVINSEKDKD